MGQYALQGQSDTAGAHQLCLERHIRFTLVLHARVALFDIRPEDIDFLLRMESPY